MSRFFRSAHLGDMTTLRSLVWVFSPTFALLACSTEGNVLIGHDGAAGALGGAGGGATAAGGTGAGGATSLGGTTGTGAGGVITGSGGTVVAGSGGAGLGGAVGTGGKGGAGGITVGGSGGSGSGGSGSGGSTITKDAGVTDTASDVPIQTDGADAIVECEPGYPVGSTKPAGDGCNNCSCLASGAWACTKMACPAPDAAGDGSQCPSGQIWCPGCPPNPGLCASVCPAVACVVDAGAPLDAGAGACSSLATLADCQARSDCHAVFVDPGTCGCAGAGCCAHFSRCVDGGKALCTAPATLGCDMATPFCESPYVLAYTAICYEGCVLDTECGP
jgi:hypothetical protein